VPQYNRFMPVLLRLLSVVLLLSLPLPAQEAGPRVRNPEPPASPVPQHRFWDRTNLLLFSGVALSRGLDHASTRHFLARGDNEVLIPDDVVNNSAGFAGLEAAGAATSIGISYIFHRTGHHTMERWMSIGHISVTGVGVVWNYSLKSKHP
jgi:hypothetical protein